MYCELLIDRGSEDGRYVYCAVCEAILEREREVRYRDRRKNERGMKL